MIHFEYDGAATLFFKFFNEEGERLECCPRGDSSRDTVSAALEFACSRQLYGVVAVAWNEALAAARTCRGVRASGIWSRRPRPAATYGARAA